MTTPTMKSCFVEKPNNLDPNSKKDGETNYWKVKLVKYQFRLPEEICRLVHKYKLRHKFKYRMPEEIC